MLSRIAHELKLWKNGHRFVAGVDEAGRGPLAGPLVVAAVVLDRDILNEVIKCLNCNECVPAEHTLYTKINDSKKLSASVREKCADFIREHALTYSIIEISHEIIDTKGISTATQMGFHNSTVSIKYGASHILTDNFKINAIKESKQTNIVKGDQLSISIAAASILAKTHRDRLMEKYHEQFPKYGFDQHKGYGTAAHLDALKTFGPCEIHRKSFKGVVV